MLFVVVPSRMLRAAGLGMKHGDRSSMWRRVFVTVARQEWAIGY